VPPRKAGSGAMREGRTEPHRGVSAHAGNSPSRILSRPQTRPCLGAPPHRRAASGFHPKRQTRFRAKGREDRVAFRAPASRLPTPLSARAKVASADATKTKQGKGNAMTNTDKTATLARLNDLCRTAMGVAGKLVQTAGICALPSADQSAIREKVETFDAVTPDNDAHAEHDFGAFEPTASGFSGRSTITTGPDATQRRPRRSGANGARPHHHACLRILTTGGAVRERGPPSLF
jgi:hypothetical protein